MRSKNGTLPLGQLWAMMGPSMSEASCGRGKSCAVAQRLAAFAVLFLFSMSSTLQGQDPPPQKPDPQPRQKIGLVLEGGGALGLAHIGVLQWLYRASRAGRPGCGHEHGRPGRRYLRYRPFSR